MLIAGSVAGTFMRRGSFRYPHPTPPPEDLPRSGQFVAMAISRRLPAPLCDLVLFRGKHGRQYAVPDVVHLGEGRVSGLQRPHSGFNQGIGNAPPGGGGIPGDWKAGEKSSLGGTTSRTPRGLGPVFF